MDQKIGELSVQDRGEQSVSPDVQKVSVGQRFDDITKDPYYNLFGSPVSRSTSEQTALSLSRKELHDLEQSQSPQSSQEIPKPKNKVEAPIYPKNGVMQRMRNGLRSAFEAFGNRIINSPANDDMKPMGK